MDINKIENLSVEDIECISTNTPSQDKSNLKYKVRNTDDVQQGNYGAKEDTKRQNLNQKKIGRDQRNRIFDCDTCGNRFTNKIILNLHIQVNHMKSNDGYLCICGKNYEHESSLYQHVRHKHTNESIIREMCGPKSKNLSNHKLHLGNVHGTDLKILCEYCGKMFKSKSNFTQHMRTHTGNKPYTCSECSQSFSRNSTLNVHMRTHTGEKTFSCSYCDQSFVYSTSLKRHERTHTGEKPFSCSYCDQSFSQHSTLKTHERTHTGYKPFFCSYCDQNFSQNSTLKRHERTHTGDKPFSCSHCDKSFSQRSSLKRHERTHIGEKQFSCFHCGQNFGQEQHLQEHEKMHTSEEKCPVCLETFKNPDDLLEHMMNQTVNLDSICNTILASLTV